jgi:shikimate kinase
MIHLIGPGGAGKTVVGPLVAQRLGVAFHDLDAVFARRFGDIDAFIAARGYPAYARANVQAYLGVEADGVIAASSGFMTYPAAVHPRYAAVRDAIGRSPTTFVLLPSLDLETCVAETVRRQLARPHTRRTAAREEAVIRERFGLYLAVPAPRVETLRPPPHVAAEIVARLLPHVASSCPSSPDSPHAGRSA